MLCKADSFGLHHYGYGAGRRMCPGIHLAERSMWRVTAKLLWAFEFEELPDKPLDVNAYTSSNLVRPLEYEVKVTPRSKQHQDVIRRELISASEFVSQYD
jgi:cytochrome P450